MVSEAAPGLQQRVWMEMDYRLLDICCVTQGGHIQHLRGIQKNKLGEFLFPSAGRTLQFFPPPKRADCMKCVREFRITLYGTNTEVVPVK